MSMVFKNFVSKLVQMSQKVQQMTKNLCYIELSQIWHRAYFKHADYEYRHDFLKYCHQIGPNGT